MQMRLRTLISVVAYLVFCGLAFSQASENPALIAMTAERDAYQIGLENAAETVRKLEEEIAELTAAPARLKEDKIELYSAYMKTQIEQYEFQKVLRNHSIDVFRWQLFSGYTLLAMVMAIAALGVYLSYKEVMSAINSSAKDATNVATQEATPAKEKTELILSLQKIQVTSAVAGIVILVLSLGFLYLFLDKVYQLEPFNLSTNEVVSTGGNPNQPDQEDG